MVDILKSVGASTTAKGGMDHDNVSPDQWLETLTHALEVYLRRNTSEIYDVRFSYPNAEERAEMASLKRTMIHFEIDEIENPMIGFGDGTVDVIVDDIAETSTPIYGQPHIVNFDVGIWANANTGGVTTRMRAYQELDRLFSGAPGYNKAKEEGDFEILRFMGGSFITAEIGEIPVYRVVGIELIVRVYGRRIGAPLPYIAETVQEPGLDVSDEIIVG